MIFAKLIIARHNLKFRAAYLVKGTDEIPYLVPYLYSTVLQHQVQ